MGIKRTVIIADDEPITRIDLIEILEEYDYEILGSVATGLDAVEMCRKHHPTLVLMDVKMPLLDGLKASTIINEEKLAGCVVLLTAYSDQEIIAKAVEAGVMGYVIKPISENALIPAIEVSLAKQKELGSMQSEVTRLREKMEERKVIERAKGILCERKNMTEQQAYEYMRNLSMNKGYKMVKIANAILMDENIADSGDRGGN